MTYLLPHDADEDQCYTEDYWMLEGGPFGVSGFCMDGTEVGNHCYICETSFKNQMEAKSHFHGKRHAQKVKSIRKPRADFVLEPSTGGDMNDPDNLFLPNRCKVCEAELCTEEQRKLHYMSDRHQKKVRHYFLVKIGAREKVESKNEEVQDEPPERDEYSYCSVCDIELSGPIVAHAHYAGKKHTKKLRERGQINESEKTFSNDKTIWHHCSVCEVKLNSEHQYKVHMKSGKHIKKAQTVNRRQREQSQILARKRKEIEMILREDDAKRMYLEMELDSLMQHEAMNLPW